MVLYGFRSIYFCRGLSAYEFPIICLLRRIFGPKGYSYISFVALFVPYFRFLPELFSMRRQCVLVPATLESERVQTITAWDLYSALQFLKREASGQGYISFIAVCMMPYYQTSPRRC